MTRSPRVRSAECFYNEFLSDLDDDSDSDDDSDILSVPSDDEYIVDEGE